MFIFKNGLTFDK